MPKYNLPTAATTAKVAAANVVAMPIATPTFEGWLYRHGAQPVWTTFHALPGTDPNTDGAYWYALTIEGEDCPECVAGCIGSNADGEPIFVDYGHVVPTTDRPISQGGDFRHKAHYLQAVREGLPRAIYNRIWFDGRVCGYHIAAYRALAGNEKANNLKWLEQQMRYQP